MKILWKNTSDAWGLITILLHWVSAILIMVLFILGLWMTSLDYYSDWYTTLPHWHKSLGIILFGLTIFRIVWRLCNPPPRALTTHKAWEQKSGHAMHVILYLITLAILVTGYLIPTADGVPIDVFNWFSVPAIVTAIPQQDLIGKSHLYLAYLIISLSTIHALAALKHHLIDKDSTLKRMLTFTNTNKEI